MGLEDLVKDDVLTSSNLADPENSGSGEDGRAKGEDDYFSKKPHKRRGVLDNIRDEIEIIGEEHNTHTLYAVVTPMIKVKSGTILRKDGTEVVDVDEKDFTVVEKQLKMMYGDKSQMKSVYEIKVR